MAWFLAGVLVLIVVLVVFGKGPKKTPKARAKGQGNRGHPESPKRRPSVIEGMRAESDKRAEERRAARQAERSIRQGVRRTNRPE